MRPIKTQQGIALVYIVLLISGLSVMLVHHAYVSKIRAERSAFTFTISQIHHVLNLAYAHRLSTGHWPRSNDGVCQTPEQYINDAETPNNGWGYPLEGLDECGGASESYVIQQIIPDSYFQLFEESLEEELERDYTGVADGMVRMRLELPLSLVEQQRIHIGKLTNRNSDPLSFDRIVCSLGGTPRYVGGLDGVCGSAPAPVPGDSNYIPFTYPPPDSIFVNIGLDIRQRFDETEVRYGMGVIDSYRYDINDEGRPWFFDYDDDGHDFADEQCPRDRHHQRYTIDAVLLAWCE
ncbi:hypothetical protein [Ketobacter alkanivorans]|uniref:Uncharacterized protein n=1 Tax=Ketobacter alkanivorans TaxID=1917421 RepID=A0A2K9LPZ9_9GAMM|nr:hypothetical protein [Ketobacter alkanivorans]AUM14363.1 hypothetical protein Kalk_18875 [Ketobacter alkanivorans]